MPKDIWKRGNTWYLNIWDPATKRKIKRAIGPNRRQAEDAAAQIRSKIRASSLGIRAMLNAPTLDEFIPRFLTENYADKATPREAERAIMRFRQYAGNIPLTGVTKRVVLDYIAQRRKDHVPCPFRGKSKSSPNAQTWIPKKKVKNGTINREVDTVKRMMSFAYEHEIIDWNPLAGMKKLSTKDSIRKPELSPEQIQRLLEEAPRSKDWRFYPALVLSLYTGRRRSDIIKRRTTDYNRTQGLLFLGKTKKGEDERIRLAGAAQWALDTLFDKAKGGWLFPNAVGTGPIKDLDTAYRQAKKRAGIDPGLRWHDLRHVAISYMLMAGVEFNTVASLVGHTTGMMIEKTYGHLSQRHKEATAVIYGGYMDRITGLGAIPAQATIMESERAVSAQVADLISGEAARGLVARHLLLGGGVPQVEPMSPPMQE